MSERDPHRVAIDKMSDDILALFPGQPMTVVMDAVSSATVSAFLTSRNAVTDPEADRMIQGAMTKLGEHLIALGSLSKEDSMLLAHDLFERVR